MIPPVLTLLFLCWLPWHMHLLGVRLFAVPQS